MEAEKGRAGHGDLVVWEPPPLLTPAVDSHMPSSHSKVHALTEKEEEPPGLGTVPNS